MKEHKAAGECPFCIICIASVGLLTLDFQNSDKSVSENMHGAFFHYVHVYEGNFFEGSLTGNRKDKRYI